MEIYMEISMENINFYVNVEIMEILHWNLGEEGLPSANFRFSHGTS